MKKQEVYKNDKLIKLQVDEMQLDKIANGENYNMKKVAGWQNKQIEK